MQFSIELLESNSDIRQKILFEIKEHMREALNKARPNILTKIKEIVSSAIVSQPEYASLIDGKLKYELGIPDAASRVQDIMNIWLNNIIIDIQPLKITNLGITGGFGIKMISENFEDIISSNAATIIDSISGQAVPWLEWLLLAGGQILVRNYSVKMGPNNRSRTGLAIMIESDNNWRMPPEFAGTVSNNWITRALSNIDDNIYNTFETEIERYI